VKCKVLLVGEGASDIGDIARRHSEGREPEGFLQPLLRKMVGGQVELELEGRRIAYLPRDPRKKSRAGRLQAENAARALALASVFGMNALVLAFDVDKTPGETPTRVEGRRRLRDLRASAERGFAQVREDDPAAADIYTALAVPLRMIEAWALGDRAALAALLGVAPKELRYGTPEGLWGDEADEDADHPKRIWRRLTKECPIEFAEIGAAADPEALREACPDSFAPFAADVEAALLRCLASRGTPARPWPPRRKGKLAGEWPPAREPEVRPARAGTARGRRPRPRPSGSPSGGRRRAPRGRRR
jgi:hypothetical protein